MRTSLQFIFLLVYASVAACCQGQEVTISPDVVYGHKSGLAMTCDVFTPEQDANGAAVLFMVSGGWFSNWSPPEQTQHMFKPLTDKGFTVFAVRHGSSPKFSIAEAVDDVRRSVRFIRGNADRFEVDPDRIGVFGMSAGGHLSLMLGTASDEGNAESKDPVEHISDRVNAVVAYVAPTDLRVMAKDAPDRLPAYDRFPALEIDAKSATADSPIIFVTADDAPTLLLAGAKDDLVPISYSRNIEAAFEKAGVTSELIEFENAGHGFGGEDAKKATEAMVNWFVTHLDK
ncbi:alpha/beta hydrolase family protein [Rubripirellula reticaptiva]|uniref:Acetylxylan esterase n=1 Tax=Rubripirellula reticaptiva TaxID=2528013 RepID=A0A5C6ETU1_9BACT|nr:alpha/beta hydrolase [Rubripirellula reticaptiva]TWU51804.1 Acetylxylan esterase precursor [Rubripirellula reticaptiva]